jgi:hypothetical protein
VPRPVETIGEGLGFGDGEGKGLGFGDGEGNGLGFGDGEGNGLGFGDGEGNGLGFGDGEGNGLGFGDGEGNGLGFGAGGVSGSGLFSSSEPSESSLDESADSKTDFFGEAPVCGRQAVSATLRSAVAMQRDKLRKKSPHCLIVPISLYSPKSYSELFLRVPECVVFDLGKMAKKWANYAQTAEHSLLWLGIGSGNGMSTFAGF